MRSRWGRELLLKSTKPTKPSSMLLVSSHLPADGALADDLRCNKTHHRHQPPSAPSQVWPFVPAQQLKHIEDNSEEQMHNERLSVIDQSQPNNYSCRCLCSFLLLLLLLLLPWISLVKLYLFSPSINLTIAEHTAIKYQVHDGFATFWHLLLATTALFLFFFFVLFSSLLKQYLSVPCDRRHRRLFFSFFLLFAQPSPAQPSLAFCFCLSSPLSFHYSLNFSFPPTTPPAPPPPPSPPPVPFPAITNTQKLCAFASNQKKKRKKNTPVSVYARINEKKIPKTTATTTRQLWFFSPFETIWKYQVHWDKVSCDTTTIDWAPAVNLFFYLLIPPPSHVCSALSFFLSFFFFCLFRLARPFPYKFLLSIIIWRWWWWWWCRWCWSVQITSMNWK